jgi:hypothetical protein
MPPVHGHAPADPGQPHHVGFDKALKDALDKASGLGDPGTYEVDVQFGATVEVVNPGTIQQYKVTLNPH